MKRHFFADQSNRLSTVNDPETKRASRGLAGEYHAVVPALQLVFQVGPYPSAGTGVAAGDNTASPFLRL